MILEQEIPEQRSYGGGLVWHFLGVKELEEMEQFLQVEMVLVELVVVGMALHLTMDVMEKVLEFMSSLKFHVPQFDVAGILSQGLRIFISDCAALELMVGF